MRKLLLAGMIGVCLLPVSVGAAESPIPRHPNELRFADASTELPTVENRRVVLQGGSVVYLAEDHTLPLVEISMAQRVGSFLEPADRTGIAYLTATQIRRGGAADLSANQFDDRSDSFGARLDTMSGTTRSGASLSVPTWALDEGLDLFFAMIGQPRFQADRLAVARGNLLESLSRRNEDALEILRREWEWLMYGEDHFSTRPMTPASLEVSRKSDLEAFHQAHWHPEQMILAISGDFDRLRLLAELERRFGELEDLESEMSPPSWPPSPPAATAAPGLYHYEMDVAQAKVMLGHRLPEQLAWTDPDRYALAVVGELLGGPGAISRIAGRLRTAEGLVYRASADLYPGDLWAGELEIFFETRGGSVERAVRFAIEEVERLQRESVHPLELAVAKESLLARLRLRFDTAEEIAGYFAEDELIGRPHTFWQDSLEGIAAITIADVQRIANKYLQPRSLRVLVVGRWQEISTGESPGTSPLETLVGHPRTQRQPRDPLTLEIADQK